jgi:hypothetical protein
MLTVDVSTTPWSINLERYLRRQAVDTPVAYGIPAGCFCTLRSNRAVLRFHGRVSTSSSVLWHIMSISLVTRTGPFGHQYFHATGRPSVLQDCISISHASIRVVVVAATAYCH